MDVEGGGAGEKFRSSSIAVNPVAGLQDRRSHLLRKRVRKRGRPRRAANRAACRVCRPTWKKSLVCGSFGEASWESRHVATLKDTPENNAMTTTPALCFSGKNEVQDGRASRF